MEWMCAIMKHPSLLMDWNQEIQERGHMSPLNDYKCPSCNHIVPNVWTISTDPAEPACTMCGQIMVKMMSTFEPRFIGSGFYETDYKKPKKENSSNE